MRHAIVGGIAGGIAWVLAALLLGKKDVSEVLLGAVVFGTVYCLAGAILYWRKTRHASKPFSNDSTKE